MIGHTSKTTSWPTGVEQQFLLFLKLCLRRRVKRIEQAMEKQLLTPEEYSRGLRVRFNFEGLLRADSMARAQFYQIMRQIGGLTINEIRALEGKGPVPGGNEVMVQMQDIPLSQAGKQQTEQPQADQGGEDDDAEG
jgi:HK97 family phage portal protein